MILKNLIHRKGRTLLTVLGISIGVAAIIGLGALNEGLQAGYGSVMTGSQADFVLRDADSVDLLAVSSVPYALWDDASSASSAVASCRS